MSSRALRIAAALAGAAAAALVVLWLTGVFDPSPRVALARALQHASSTPHAYKGTAIRTIGTVRGGPSGRQGVVAWNVWGKMEGDWAEIELKGESGARRVSYGRRGWWVENHEGLWLAYPPPHECIEWLDPAGLEASRGLSGPVNGRPCRQVIGKWNAGELTFDLDRSDGRIVQVSGAVKDRTDAYAFKLEYLWEPTKVTPPEEARLMLDILQGKSVEGDDPEARGLVEKGWGGILESSVIVNTLQIDFANASEFLRRASYYEQAPPLRAWSLAEGDRTVFIWSDDVRAVVADTAEGPTREAKDLPIPAVKSVPRLAVTAAFAGTTHYRDEKCRLVGARLKSQEASADDPPQTGWLWIAEDGRILRQVLVGKGRVEGGGHYEITAYVDMDFKYDPGSAGWKLMARGRKIFGR
jgi:hypothetical protein